MACRSLAASTPGKARCAILRHPCRARRSLAWGRVWTDGNHVCRHGLPARPPRGLHGQIREKLKLPLCNAQFGRPMVPFFQPMIVPWGGKKGRKGEREMGRRETWTRAPIPHLSSLIPHRPTVITLTLSQRATGSGGPGEDYSFCERARQCGYKIMADTSIRLWHIGEYAYGWEDAGLEKVRHDSFLFMINDEKK